MNRIKVTNDLVFKSIFGRQENERLLKALLNALFESSGDERIDSLQILNPISVTEMYADKVIVLDIKATDRSGRIIHIEVQMGNLSWFTDRFVYYNAKTLSEQLKEGSLYESINRVISIAIIGDGRVLPSEPYVHNIYMYKNTKSGSVLSRLTELHFIELDKFNSSKKYLEMTSLEKWLHFLKLGDLLAKKEIEEPEGIIKEEEIQMAINYYREYTADDKLIDMIEARKKAEHDRLARNHFEIQEAKAEALAAGKAEGLAEGKAEGKAEGLAEGVTKSKFEIARNMLKLGVDKNIILQATGISVEELKKIN